MEAMTISPMTRSNPMTNGLNSSISHTQHTPYIQNTQETSSYLEKRQTNIENNRSRLDETNMLKKTTKEFNKLSDELKLDIKFAYNDKLDQVYLNVVDKNTGKVIRKLPTEAAMKISESMKDLIGTLFDKKG